ncbi:RICIN domain-containing protein [Lentzea sp. BCCO 10_0061]|uniref:RICIN domain-containing protein n=1 Tax=Lentzea sokolovensis TaxID=3095429 RepID=A0ABU4V8U0_9PSEU|nr:RICIN domain-containing protein [Lentzea sp. BCCO 10_0061]MDX8148109.1 RICIN domain-containing protein [Lentzea sp. BCCO 10_0061]
MLTGIISPASAAPTPASPVISSMPEVGTSAVFNDYRIRNLNSGKCLLVRGGADNTQVVQNTCLDFADQKWVLEYKGSFARIRNMNSGKCLLVRGLEDNTPVVQNTCLDFADQYWNLSDYGTGLLWIQNVNSGKCLLVRGGNDNAPLVQSACGQFPDQAWY